MSDRRPEHQPEHPYSRSTTRPGRSAVPAVTSPPQRAAAGARSVTSPALQRHSENAGRHFELPPLPPASSLTGGSFSPSTTRIGGVSSILNPPLVEEAPQGLRRRVSQLESPSTSTRSLPPIFTGYQAPQRINTVSSAFPAPSPSSQYAVPVEPQPRRILTPRSPSLHRAASLGQLNPSNATIDAQRVPFPGSPRSRAYAIEPGTSGAPPLPTPPAALRSAYGFPAPTAPLDAARRGSTGTARTRNLSPSASPTTSYSSYSQAEQTSPASQYVSGSYNTTAGAENHRPMGIPISSSGGQNVYQMMTLETTSGTVQLPVDVQAASRVADEKRRRNAGASARFRQRRKEKEREASTTIGKLEQQVREMSEDADFYRRERDFLAGILNHVPGGERHFPRPTSPRRRRSSAMALPGQIGTGSLTFPTEEELTIQSPGEGRNVRRRTATMSLPPPPQPTTPGLGGTSGPPSYGQRPYATPLAPQPPPASHNTQYIQAPSPIARATASLLAPMTPGHSTQQTPTGPPQSLQLMPQAGPWNPYPPERRPSGPPNQPRGGR
ncbi:hypothetical protein LTR37_014884 [Vermiconidia calcicola]|uniref:Uncharacterized protein n=1 Tax=Vermiconidia calcicola TaxID=1690605 RepID=A0ACC3MS69_9PEZI|nr:hypothetical protein LTR37_014884 [Vermiconidia calcicola]